MVHTQSMRLSRAGLRAATLVIAYTMAPFASPQESAALKPNSEAVYRALRDSGIAEVLLVENIVLRRDAGVITLKSGMVGLTPPAAGRDTVAVFVGEGEFALTPASSIEKDYLKSLTDQDSVKEAFDRALFCFTDDTDKEIRRDAKPRPADPKLAETLHEFRKHLRTRTETPDRKST